jgi:hypothetical protein
MTKYLLALAILSVPTVASANVPGSIGIGVEAQINGTGGISVNYDGGKYDAAGFFGLVDPGTNNSTTTYEVGGRFFYHLHQTPTTDFGLGGSIGLDSTPNANNDRQNLLFLEPGFQIRWFVAANLALSFAGGIIIGVADAQGVAIGGQSVAGGANAVAGAGITYYFN